MMIELLKIGVHAAEDETSKIWQDCLPAPASPGPGSTKLPGAHLREHHVPAEIPHYDQTMDFNIFVSISLFYGVGVTGVQTEMFSQVPLILLIKFRSHLFCYV